MATANYGSANISLFLGSGDGTFGAVTNLSARTSPTSVICTDLNEDGKLDLVVANNGNNSVNCDGPGLAPYIIQQPANQTTSLGNPASFHVFATSGSPLPMVEALSSDLEKV